MSEEKKYYHIFSVIDGELSEKININREQVDQYLSDTTPDQVKYGNVKVFSSKTKIDVLSPRICVKLSDKL